MRYDLNDYEEVKKYVTDYFSKTQNFKWTSTRGSALSEIIQAIDKGFLDSVLFSLDRKEEHIKRKEEELKKKEKELKEREKAIQPTFYSTKTSDVYSLARGLKELYKDRYGALSDTGINAIQTMVNRELERSTVGLEEIDNGETDKHRYGRFKGSGSDN